MRFRNLLATGLTIIAGHAFVGCKEDRAAAPPASTTVTVLSPQKTGSGETYLAQGSKAKPVVHHGSSTRRGNAPAFRRADNGNDTKDREDPLDSVNEEEEILFSGSTKVGSDNQAQSEEIPDFSEDPMDLGDFDWDAFIKKFQKDENQIDERDRLDPVNQEEETLSSDSTKVGSDNQAQSEEILEVPRDEMDSDDFDLDAYIKSEQQEEVNDPVSNDDEIPFDGFAPSEEDADQSRGDRIAALNRYIVSKGNPDGHVYIGNVRRAQAFEDAYNALLDGLLNNVRSGNILSGIMDEAFYGPAAQREVVSAMAAQLFNPDFGLFKLSDEVPNYAYINPDAPNRHPHDHERMFRAVGRFFGLALARNTPLGVTIPTFFWASLIGQRLELPDIKKDEPQLFRSLGYLFTATKDELADMGLTIDGKDFEPTTDNLKELVERRVNSLIDPEVRPLMDLIRRGLEEVVSAETIRNYVSAADLREFFIGSTLIDIEDLRINSDTELLASEMRQWLWNVLTSFDQEMRKKFLKFATNLDHLPIGGFKQIQPRIQIYGDGELPSQNLPSVHHCMNSMRIPRYTSEAELEKKLTQAILGSNWGL